MLYYIICTCVITDSTEQKGSVASVMTTANIRFGLRPAPYVHSFVSWPIDLAFCAIYWRKRSSLGPTSISQNTLLQEINCYCMSKMRQIKILLKIV